MLPQQAARWATPTTGDSKSSGSRVGNPDTAAHPGVTLTDQAVRGLYLGAPSATAQGWRPDGASWPTPDASAINMRESPETFFERKWRHASKEDATRAGVPLTIAAQIATGLTGLLDQATLTGGAPTSRVVRVLNPLFCEALMGWPEGWTDCERSATVAFRAWLRSHGRCCATH
jgi:hypothetical protein